MRLAAASLLAALAVAVPAHAQDAQGHDVVVLSVGGDAPEAVAREAREGVARALEGDDVRVLAEGEIALRIPPARLRGCDSIACAFALGRELGVSMVAAVATWQGPSGPASVTVSLVVGERRAHAASEDVGERGLLDATARAVRGAQDAMQRALLVEGSAPARGDEQAEPARDAEPQAPASGDRPLEEYVLPTILALVGLAAIAGAVYALLPGQCELTGASGACLRGDGPAVGLGVLLSIVGGASAIGAIIWLVVGGSPPDMGRIDVVLAPDGGGLRWGAAF